MFILRQIAARLATGKKLTSIGTAITFPYRLTDVLRKYVLKIDDGDFAAESFTAAVDSYEEIGLPANYTSADRLFVQIRTNGVVKVSIDSPDHGPSYVVIKGTNGSTLGDHDGLLTFCCTISSITIENPASASDAVRVEYFCFKLPDLTDADSYRIGDQALGVPS